ncbi:MAG TPA: hypothetical protein DFJ59_03665 [Alphaproteobacteria bacterium]|nr:hypothetical protein [Alphaproteobacteria bacterium]
MFSQHSIDEDIARLGLQRSAIIPGGTVHQLGRWAEQRCTSHSIDIRQPEAGIGDCKHWRAGRQRGIALVPEQTEQS